MNSFQNSSFMVLVVYCAITGYRLPVYSVTDLALWGVVIGIDFEVPSTEIKFVARDIRVIESRLRETYSFPH
jgi:hypothetical protein